MTPIDADVRDVRDALLPAVRRDLARVRRRPARRVLIPAAIGATLLAGGGIATATGLLFAEPEHDRAVPDVAEWMYFSHDPADPTGKSGPVLRRPRAEAMARANRATEAELAERGITARCGSYRGHPLACYLPDGKPVPSPAFDEALYESGALRDLESSPESYETRHLTEAQARQWLCEHPRSRPSDWDASGC